MSYLDYKAIISVDFDVNCNFPHLIEFYKSDSRKISADVYIDDKCLFDIPDWKTKYEIITKRFESNNNNNT